MKAVDVLRLIGVVMNFGGIIPWVICILYGNMGGMWISWGIIALGSVIQLLCKKVEYGYFIRWPWEQR